MVRIITIAAVLGAGGLLAACSSVPPGAPLEGSAAAASTSPDERTCREILIPPSNVPRTYCATGAEWAEYEADQRRASREALRRMNGGAFSGPDNSPAGIPY